MAFKIYKKSGVSQTEEINIPSSNAVSKDALLALDTSNNGWVPATSSSTTLTVDAIAQDALSSQDSDTLLRAILLEPGQLVIGDCANNTASNQVGLRHALSNSLTVNNTASEDTTTTGVMRMVKIIGSASDKKAIFRVMSTVVAA